MVNLIGLLMGGLGGIMLFYAMKMFRSSTRRDTYKTVTAKILDSQLETDSNGTGQSTTSLVDWGQETDPNRTGQSTTYIPKIKYEYTVEGKSYTNDNLYPGPATSGSSEKDEQQAILNKYPEGETVEAFYDPSDPSLSFLENESRNRQAVATGVIGGGLLLFGLVLIVGIPV